MPQWGEGWEKMKGRMIGVMHAHNKGPQEPSKLPGAKRGPENTSPDNTQTSILQNSEKKATVHTAQLVGFHYSSPWEATNFLLHLNLPFQERPTFL